MPARTIQKKEGCLTVSSVVKLSERFTASADGWEKRDARARINEIVRKGYFALALLPHDFRPGGESFYEDKRGKVPCTFTVANGWGLAKDWTKTTKRLDVNKMFVAMSTNTRKVPNWGVRCGEEVRNSDGTLRGFLSAIDVDADDEALIGDLHELFGRDNPIRRGRRGGTFMCVSDSDTSVDFILDNARKVQLLAKGRQTAVYGRHPKASRLWKWEYSPESVFDGDAELPAIADLPVVQRAQIDAILSAHGYAPGKGSKATSPEERTALSKRGKEIEADLNKTAPLDFEEVDEALGIKALIETDAPLKRKLMRDYDEVQDHSTHDLQVCNMIRRHLGDKFDHHAARAVLAHFPSCSEEEKQTAHHVANIMAKAEQVKTFEERGREAFGAVEDESEEDDGGVPLEHLRMQENIRRKEEREAAEREAEAEVVKLKAEIAELDATDVKPKTEAPKTKFLWSMDIFENFTPPDELIEGLLPAVGTACIVADSNVGKTFFAIHMLDTIMRGEKFFGRNTERGGALMVAGEGRAGLNKRLAALHKERPYTDGRGIGISYKLPEFSSDASITVEILKLEKLIKSYGTETGETTRIVVLDNLIAMVGGGDINASKDTRPLFRALDDLAEKLQICIVVIHHENRSGSTAGSFAIRASTDVMLHITEDRNGVRTVSGDKDRDNPKAQKMQFRLKSVKVGVNKWGSDVTSCVVVPALSGEAMGVVEEGEEAPPLKIPDDPDDRLNRLLEATRECAEKAAAHGEPAEMVPLSPKEIGAVFNTHRERYCGLNGKPLAPLNREGVYRIIARALEAEKLVLRKAKYHLAE